MLPVLEALAHTGPGGADKEGINDSNVRGSEHGLWDQISEVQILAQPLKQVCDHR